jgi:DNA polymerase III subunit beta
VTVFSLPAGELHAAAEWAARATPSRTSTPVVSGLLIEAADDQVTINGFDFERRASVAVKALVAQPGRLLLPARLLATIASVADRGDVEVDGSGSEAKVTAGRGRWTVPTMPVDEYPTLPSPGEPVGTVDAEEFSRALKRVLPAVHRGSSKDDNSGDVLEHLLGVKMESEGDELVMVATDRYRLTCARIPWTPQGDQELDALVPYNLMEVAARADTSGPLDIHVGDNRRLFGTSTATHMTVGSQIGKDYAQWRRVMPADTGWVATLRSAELAKALKQVAPGLGAKNQVKMAFDGESVTVTAAGEHGGAEVQIEAPLKGEPILVCFGVDYLKAALDAIGAEQVDMMFTSSTGAVRMTGDDFDQYQHLVMTVRN